MNINIETKDKHTIRSYSNSEIMVGDDIYKSSLIISKETIISLWQINLIKDLDLSKLEPILNLNPEVIIIGHEAKGIMIPMQIMEYLSKKRIGIECMTIGAASRTFNVLLSEDRSVVAGFIW